MAKAPLIPCRMPTCPGDSATTHLKALVHWLQPYEGSSCAADVPRAQLRGEAPCLFPVSPCLLFAGSKARSPGPEPHEGPVEGKPPNTPVAVGCRAGAGRERPSGREDAPWRSRRQRPGVLETPSQSPRIPEGTGRPRRHGLLSSSHLGNLAIPSAQLPLGTQDGHPGVTPCQLSQGRPTVRKGRTDPTSQSKEPASGPGACPAGSREPALHEDTERPRFCPPNRAFVWLHPPWARPGDGQDTLRGDLRTPGIETDQ